MWPHLNIGCKFQEHSRTDLIPPIGLEELPTAPCSKIMLTKSPVSPSQCELSSRSKRGLGLQRCQHQCLGFHHTWQIWGGFWAPSQPCTVCFAFCYFVLIIPLDLIAVLHFLPHLMNVLCQKKKLQNNFSNLRGLVSTVLRQAMQWKTMVTPLSFFCLFLSFKLILLE